MSKPDPTANAARMRWWQHPLTLVAWSAAVMVAYAFFPSSATAVAVAFVAWGVGVVAWMVAGDADFGPDVRAILKDVTHRG